MCSKAFLRRYVTFNIIIYDLLMFEVEPITTFRYSLHNKLFINSLPLFSEEKTPK